MISVMTPDAVARQQKRVDELRNSPELAHRITAILMDSSVTGFGMWEEYAVPKVTEILRELGREKP